ncbi:FAD binding domain-containing protein [Thermodesulfobacteriota bacterium]
MGQSEYFTPKSVEEAISLLSEYGEKAEIIAGGTDSLVRMKKGDTPPDLFINIREIQGLDYIRYEDKDGLRIGARTSIHSIVNSSLIKEKFGIIAHAAATLGTPTIRRQATIGGNLCNAAPSADMAPPLIVLGAQLKIQGGNGQKGMPVENFFTGPGQTRLNRNEILTEIQIPNPMPSSTAVYLKQTRSQGADLAIVGVAASVIMDGEVIKDVKIALGAVAPTPIRAKKAEEILKGKSPGDNLLDACGESALLESSPIDDVRSSAAYRKKLVKVLVKRAIKQITELEE